jgi:hypothetical protein
MRTRKGHEMGRIEKRKRKKGRKAGKSRMTRREGWQKGGSKDGDGRRGENLLEDRDEILYTVLGVLGDASAAAARTK